ncbi:histidine kinase [Pontibacillus halophilus JSM 076056 = DSM 19796]|uniref:histidine kinase n=1 Tax=Pontibacillus halophilus JSM 076056 = DSM 19796 TaxID=1385510 RepID=A0A0A5GH34_9BACI|nr:sensor histidine kinase [Pontibacillus halophilus]KGX91344.1 histidine kinase [Pontibacillus halophilus JSM 076056 = DSM 19796]
MIATFLRERLSWILLLVSFQLLAILLAFVDSTVPITSVLYYVLLTSTLFLLFLVIRYINEMQFYKKLSIRNHDFDIGTIPKGESPLEELVEEHLTTQVEQLRHEAFRHQQQLEEEQDELVAWIHEVKTPLSAIRLIMDKVNHEETQSQLYYEWLRIHHLLDQQLYQKRLPFMQNDLYMEKVSLRELVVTELRSLQSWCMQKGIGFELQLHGQHVLSDAKWLAFILRQLLTNAIKYSQNQDIHLTSYEKDGQIALSISDKGRGIEKQDLPRIFDKGFTSTSVHNDRSSTGMGLYLAKRIADNLRIRVTVNSIYGEGSTFTLFFPNQNDIDHVRSM